MTGLPPYTDCIVSIEAWAREGAGNNYSVPQTTMESSKFYIILSFAILENEHQIFKKHMNLVIVEKDVWVSLCMIYMNVCL